MMSMKMIKYASLFFLITFCSSTYALSSKPIVCNGTYALCSAASCHHIAGIKGKASCYCSIWNGKNIGYSTCKARQIKTGTDGEKLLLSTFSFGGKHYKYMICPKGTPWTSCLDQKCVIDKQSPNHRRAYCTCKIERNTPYATFAGNCKTKYCSKGMWSGASLTGNKTLMGILAKNIGYKNVANEACVR